MSGAPSPILKITKRLQLFVVISVIHVIGTCHAESIAAGGGYTLYNHQYLEDTAQANVAISHILLNMSDWRWQDSGWLARGPKGFVSAGTNLLHYSGELPIYLWTLHEGLWIGVERREVDTRTTLSKDRIYLANDGSTLSLTKDTEISSVIEQQRIYGIWRNQSRYPGAINWGGLFREVITSPAAANIESVNAVWFDGEFTGRGVIIGREKDARGLNFQWHIQMGQFTGKFSDQQTRPTINNRERTELHFGFQLGWHYRWYLSPYWYLVPSIQVSHSVLIQNNTNARSLNHHALNMLNLRSMFLLQRRF